MINCYYRNYSKRILIFVSPIVIRSELFESILKLFMLHFVKFSNILIIIRFFYWYHLSKQLSIIVFSFREACLQIHANFRETVFEYIIL
jgi:hypothetical protein